MSDTALTLRPLQAGDCDRLLSWIDSEDALYQWSGARAFSWPLDRGQLLRDLAAAGDAELTFAATEASGEMVGHVRLEVNRHHRLGYIGRVAVAPDQRGRGLGTALMRALARHAFDELALHRLNLVVYTFNTAAIACYRAVGFEVEGRMRDSTLGSDGYWDGLTMALLEPRVPSPVRLRRGRQDRGPARRRADRRAAQRARPPARSCPGGGATARVVGRARGDRPGRRVRRRRRRLRGRSARPVLRMPGVGRAHRRAERGRRGARRSRRPAPARRGPGVGGRARVYGARAQRAGRSWSLTHTAVSSASPAVISSRVV